MTEIELTAYVDETGEVTLKLPPEFRGEVEVIVKSRSYLPTGTNQGDPTLAENDLSKLPDFNPVPAEDIVTGGWEDIGITDSVAWVEEQRQKAREQRLNGPNEPMTLGDVLISGLVGAWEDQGITDGQTWVDEVRRKDQELHK
jgi:hypothetical protein